MTMTQTSADLTPQKIQLPSYDDVLKGKIGIFPCIHQDAIVKAIHEVNAKRKAFGPVSLREIESTLRESSMANLVPQDLLPDLPVMAKRNVINVVGKNKVELSSEGRELLYNRFGRRGDSLISCIMVSGRVLFFSDPFFNILKFLR